MFSTRIGMFGKQGFNKMIKIDNSVGEFELHLYEYCEYDHKDGEPQGFLNDHFRGVITNMDSFNHIRCQIAEEKNNLFYIRWYNPEYNIVEMSDILSNGSMRKFPKVIFKTYLNDLVYKYGKQDAI